MEDNNKELRELSPQSRNKFFDKITKESSFAKKMVKESINHKNEHDKEVRLITEICNELGVPKTKKDDYFTTEIPLHKRVLYVLNYYQNQITEINETLDEYDIPTKDNTSERLQLFVNKINDLLGG
jgi:hypothetical protein